MFKWKFCVLNINPSSGTSYVYVFWEFSDGSFMDYAVLINFLSDEFPISNTIYVICKTPGYEKVQAH